MNGMYRTKKMRWITFCLSFTALLFMTSADLAGAADSSYPSKTIVFCTHSNPGSGGDIVGRQLSEALKAQKINAVVENRPGGSGSINMAYTASRPPDGYTLGICTASLIGARYIANLPLSFRDFAPVAMLQSEEFALVARADAKWKTIDELVQDMKANPGKIKLGGGYIGSLDSLIAFQLGKVAGFKPTYVPYNDGAELTTALLGGHLSVAITNPLESAPQIQAGQIRMLALAGEKRLEYFKDVPTMRERGYDVVQPIWRGVWAPKGTPDAITNKAAEVIKKAMQEEKFKKYMHDGMLREAFLGPADFFKAMEKQDAEVSQLIKELGIAPRKK